MNRMECSADITNVFLHGMFQSELLRGTEVIWPPTNEMKLMLMGKRIFENFSDSLQIGNEEFEKWLGKFSDPLLTTGEYISDDKEHILKVLGPDVAIFTYNTIQSLLKSAEEFIVFMKERVTKDLAKNRKVNVYGYSLGGLVAYIGFALAEQRDEKFLTRVSRLVTIGSPLKGSIDATATVLGVRGISHGILKNDPGDSIIHLDQFESIYQLMTAIPHVFFFTDKNKPLTKPEYLALFQTHPLVNKEKFHKACEFQKIFRSLSLRSVPTTSCVGIDQGSHSVKRIVRVTGTGVLIPEYENGASDGTISFYEALPFDSNKFHTRLFHSNHKSLLRHQNFVSVVNENCFMNVLFLVFEKHKAAGIAFTMFINSKNGIVPLSKFKSKTNMFYFSENNKRKTISVKTKQVPDLKAPDRKVVQITLPSMINGENLPISGTVEFLDVEFEIWSEEENSYLCHKLSRIVSTYDLTHYVFTF